MNQELEQKIISLFITPSKRDRLTGFLKSGKRDKLLSEMNGPDIFDSRYMVEFTGGQREPELLIGQYKKLGMSGRVYVMSENSDWDGQKFQMSYILEESMFQCIDTLGYCWKTQTAFYEWHHSGTSYFLSRTVNA